MRRIILALLFVVAAVLPAAAQTTFLSNHGIFEIVTDGLSAGTGITISGSTISINTAAALTWTNQIIVAESVGNNSQIQIQAPSTAQYGIVYYGTVSLAYYYAGYCGPCTNHFVIVDNNSPRTFFEYDPIGSGGGGEITFGSGQNNFFVNFANEVVPMNGAPVSGASPQGFVCRDTVGVLYVSSTC